jgi:hypothetical protein
MIFLVCLESQRSDEPSHGCEPDKPKHDRSYSRIVQDNKTTRKMKHENRFRTFEKKLINMKGKTRHVRSPKAMPETRNEKP